MQKKVARLQEIEEAREKEKQRWKDFAFKSGKKGAPIAGKQKRSIFAVPDSIHGKVSCINFEYLLYQYFTLAFIRIGGFEGAKGALPSKLTFCPLP